MKRPDTEGTFTFHHATVRSETDKALLISCDELDEFKWIPKSAIHDYSDVWKKGQEPGDLVIAGWLAEKEGWL